MTGCSGFPPAVEKSVWHLCGLGVANQFRKIKLERLIKKFPVFFFPVRHGGIQSLKDVLYLTLARDTKPAAISSIQFNDVF